MTRHTALVVNARYKPLQRPVKQGLSRNGVNVITKRAY